MPIKYRAGTVCECILPDTYDDRVRICVAPNGKIIVAHPDHTPCFIEDGKLVEIIPYANTSGS